MVSNRIGSTEAIPEGTTGALYRRLSTRCPEQSGSPCAKIRPSPPLGSEQAERAQLLRHFGRQFRRSPHALPVRGRVLSLEIAPALECPLGHGDGRNQPHVVANDTERLALVVDGGGKALEELPHAHIALDDPVNRAAVQQLPGAARRIAGVKSGEAALLLAQSLPAPEIRD